MSKDESLLHRIETLLDQQLKRNLEESKLPAAAFNLAPSRSSDSGAATEEVKADSKVARKGDQEQRKAKLDEV